MPEEMPTFGAGYVSLFWGKISMVLKFVNGHVSVVRANMSTKTPKQGQSLHLPTLSIPHQDSDFFIMILV